MPDEVAWVQLLDQARKTRPLDDDTDADSPVSGAEGAHNLRRLVHDDPPLVLPRGSPVTAAGQVVIGEIPREPQAFVEREALLALADAAEQERVAVVCAVTGLRGVGKTQLAAAYARDRIGKGWWLVGWINAESRDSMLTDLARVAEALGVADPQGDSAESARRLRDHLGTRSEKGLLVFDNAADADGLRPFLPAVGGTAIVITSIDRAFTELGVAVDVAAFSRTESLGYLAVRTGYPDRGGAAAVADELGDLPLGLAQAAATIAGQHLTYLEYLERLRRVPVAALLGRVRGSSYQRSVAAALLLNVQAAEADDPTGLTSRLMRVMAALSPDGVHRNLLEGLASAETGSQAQVDAAAEHCVAWSLLTWSAAAERLIMHRLLGRVVRERDEISGRWASTVSEALDLLEPFLFSPDQAWARRDEGANLAAQVEALWHANSVDDIYIVPRQLAARSWAVRQLWRAADLGLAIDIGVRTLSDCERLLGQHHMQTLTSRINLAYAYKMAGRATEAIALFEQAIADAEQMLDVHDVLNLRDNLASTLRSVGRVSEAIALHEQVLADCEPLLGPDHELTLTSGNNLAYAYRSVGRTTEAIYLYERIVPEIKRTLGTDYWQTLTAVGNLAAVYEEAGRVSEAVALYEQNLADRERVLGPDHPDTLTSRDDLAGAYKELGRVDEAVALHEQNLADRERVLGPDHPDTLTSQTNLAGAYVSAGRISEALALLERTLADHERVLGPDHPDTLISRANLALAYHSAGRSSEAVTLAEAVLADTERVLGTDHPSTQTMRNNLADGYKVVGRIDEAIPLFEQVLTRREQLLGTDHPDTLTSQHKLAAAYQSAGRMDKAIPLFEQAVAGREQVLGTDDLRTLGSRHLLAYAYQQAGKVREAIVLCEQNLADRERILGSDHPDTIQARDNLACAYMAGGLAIAAIPLLEAVLDYSERVLGSFHADTIASQNNLAAAYVSAGRTDEALPLSREALARSEHALGPNHPQTQTLRTHLANARKLAGRDYRASSRAPVGRTDAAFLPLEAILAHSRLVLGTDHPATISWQDNLAAAFVSAGRSEEAISLLESALARSEQVLGPNHPQTLTLRTRLKITQIKVH